MMNSNYKMSCCTPDGSIWQLSSIRKLYATEAIHLTFWQSLQIVYRAGVLGVAASKRNFLPFISGNVTLSLKVWCASYSAKYGMNPKIFFVFSFGHNFCFVFLLSRPPCIPTKCDQTDQTDHTPLCWHLLLEPPSIPLPWLHQSGRRISQISRLSLPPQTKWCFPMLEMNCKWIKAPQLNFTILTPCKTSRFDQISLL